jgi:surface antigen/LysM repeat protein
MNSFHQKKWLWWIQVALSYSMVVVLLFGCMQPQYFQVNYQRNTFVGAYPVYASFSRSDEFEGIVLDNLIVWEDGSSKISYAVKAWDTIQSIAQQFWTTIQSIKDNNAVDNASLKVGQILYISYDDGVIVHVASSMSLQEFAKTYNLDLEDTMSLNYIEKADTLLEEWQEIFVNLTQKEAEKRKLIEQLPYESPFEKLRKEQEEFVSEQEFEAITQEQDFWPVQQEIISAQETAEQIRKQFEVTREEAGVSQEQQGDQQNQAPEMQQEQCGVWMCKFDGNCYYKPQQAYCVKDDPKRMWKCKQWYVQQANTCVAVSVQGGNKPAVSKPKPDKPRQEARPTTDKKTSKAVKVGYFNPRADGAPSDGWGPGQCTSFAHWYRWKHYGVKSLWFRGNAGAWLKSAARAWRLVNKSPAVGAFGISNESPVGHVFVVIGIDGEKVLIQEMNYAGRYIVTKRWKSISSIRGFIHPVKVK